MGKRVKKAGVQPKTRKEWLRRFEEDGESAPVIAKAVGYDVRTVRKQIELARQEREAKEARFAVLRQALEKHYADLVKFAEKLRSGVMNATLPPGAQSDPLWYALREHLPHSPMWRAIDRMERLSDEMRSIEQRAGERLRAEVETKSPVSFAAGSGKIGLHLDGLAAAVRHHLREKSPQHLEFQTRTVKEGWSEVSYGNWACGVVPDEQVSDVEAFVANLMAGVKEWSECADTRRTLGERRRATDAITEELTTLILRRVLPGRCKYCPI